MKMLGGYGAGTSRVGGCAHRHKAKNVQLCRSGAASPSNQWMNSLTEPI